VRANLIRYARTTTRRCQLHLYWRYPVTGVHTAESIRAYLPHPILAQPPSHQGPHRPHCSIDFRELCARACVGIELIRPDSISPRRSLLQIASSPGPSARRAIAPPKAGLALLRSSHTRHQAEPGRFRMTICLAAVDHQGSRCLPCIQRCAGGVARCAGGCRANSRTSINQGPPWARLLVSCALRPGEWPSRYHESVRGRRH